MGLYEFELVKGAYELFSLYWFGLNREVFFIPLVDILCGAQGILHFMFLCSLITLNLINN